MGKLCILLILSVWGRDYPPASLSASGLIPLISITGFPSVPTVILRVASIVKRSAGVVGAFQVRYEYGFSVLQVGPFLRREYMPVYFRQNDRHLALAETVRCTRVLRPARIHVQFDEGGELFPPCG